MGDDNGFNPHFIGLGGQISRFPAAQCKAYLMSQMPDQAEDMVLCATGITSGDQDKNMRKPPDLRAIVMLQVPFS